MFATEHLTRPSVDREASGNLAVGITGLILTTSVPRLKPSGLSPIAAAPHHAMSSAADLVRPR